MNLVRLKTTASRAGTRRIEMVILRINSTQSTMLIVTKKTMMAMKTKMMMIIKMRTKMRMRMRTKMEKWIQLTITRMLKGAVMQIEIDLICIMCYYTTVINQK